jgi:DNA gyrase subunit A
MGRATQGVRLINIKGNDSIAAVTKVMKEDEVEEVEGEIIDAVDTDESSDVETSEDTTDETQE